jgi:hypothetical protein
VYCNYTVIECRVESQTCGTNTYFSLSLSLFIHPYILYRNDIHKWCFWIGHAVHILIILSLLSMLIWNSYIYAWIMKKYIISWFWKIYLSRFREKAHSQIDIKCTTLYLQWQIQDIDGTWSENDKRREWERERVRE